MKKAGLLHAELSAVLAGLGHTQTVVIGDAGLPVPDGVPCVDLAVCAGVPSFLSVLEAVLSDYVFEAYTLAEEINARNPAVLVGARNLLSGLPERQVSHEQFKYACQSAQCVVRTGETSPYANVILVGGVNF